MVLQLSESVSSSRPSIPRLAGSRCAWEQEEVSAWGTDPTVTAGGLRRSLCRGHATAASGMSVCPCFLVHPSLRCVRMWCKLAVAHRAPRVLALFAG